MSRRIVLLLVAKVACTSALTARLAVSAPAPPPPQDPPAADAGVEGNVGAAPHDLRSIARLEAEREQAALEARVRELVGDLTSTGNPEVQVIRERIAELVRIGPAALPILVGTMDHEDGAAAKLNAGAHASRAAALLPGEEVDAELTRLAKEGTRHGRRNAARALGLRGADDALPRLIELLADEDEAVRLEAIQGLGALGREDAVPELLPFLESEDEAVAAAAIRALARIDTDQADEAVLARLRKEVQAAERWELVRAGLSHLEAHPNVDGLDVAREVLAADAAPTGVRLDAIAALGAIGAAHPNTGRVALKALSAATRLGIRPLVRAAALAMLSLGDDSGVDAVTADYDFDLQRNPKNFNSRYKRADVYLEFRRWKSAYQDLQYGLKIEKEPRDPERVYFALARAAAGMGRNGDAAKYLRRLTTRDFSSLPTEYPEFREMAEDSRYASLFERPQ